MHMGVHGCVTCVCDAVNTSLESLRSESGMEWKKQKRQKLCPVTKKSSVFTMHQDLVTHPWTSPTPFFKILHVADALSPCEGKDTAQEWYSPGKNREWLAGRKVTKCDISHNGAVQKSCRVTVKCQHSVSKTKLKWKESLNYFCSALNIQAETGLIMSSDLQLHFTAMLVLPLLALSFSKLYILKAQTTKIHCEEILTNY